MKLFHTNIAVMYEHPGNLGKWAFTSTECNWVQGPRSDDSQTCFYDMLRLISFIFRDVLKVGK